MESQDTVPKTDEGDQTEQLIGAIYEGIVEIPGWSTFLDRIRAFFGVAVASILIESNNLGSPEHLQLFSQGTAAAVREQINGFSAQTIFAGGHGDGLHLHDVMLPVGAAGQSFAASSLNLSAAIEPGIAFAFGLWHRVGGQPFGDTDRALCRVLLPHLTRAMRIFVQYAQSYRERAVYQAVIDRIGVGVALVDAKSAIMATNAIGAEILAGTSGLKIVHGRLVAGLPAAARALEGYVRAATEAQTLPHQDTGWPLALERSENPSPLTLVVHPGPAVQPVNAPLRRSAIVVMRDPDRRASVSADVVRQLFGLTPAEAALATLLALGADLDEASEALGVSRNTARSQLRSIFMKTNVKRQSELVRMILSSVATLSN
jgi:DNA-binding CsgD family transcriptional regulator